MVLELLPGHSRNFCCCCCCCCYCWYGCLAIVAEECLFASEFLCSSYFRPEQLSRTGTGAWDLGRITTPLESFCVGANKTGIFSPVRWFVRSFCVTAMHFRTIITIQLRRMSKPLHFVEEFKFSSSTLRSPATSAFSPEG